MTESRSTHSPRVLPGHAVLWGKGFCMGVADVIPGVSGGTMALILGIYSDLIRAIRSFDWEALRLLKSGKFSLFSQHVHWRFLLVLGLGVLFAIFSMSRAVSWLLVNMPVFVWSFFFGLIVASVFRVGRDVGRWTAGAVLCLAAGAAGAFFLAGNVALNSPEGPAFLFVCGALAACAMILPGISGAFILVLLGRYHFVLEAVNQRDLAVLAVVAAGVCFGLVLFSRFLGWLLDNYYPFVLAGLTGLMLGSLRKVWPWKEAVEGAGDGAAALLLSNRLPQALDMETTLSVLLILTGAAVVLVLGALSGARR